ncbi:hypothetical protein ZIOFF_033012 [Zingiber officinale]|uniref:Uncharacterized protein n=1 Tax=Zingiber officinale TaxID=94328 RepID=A0A8J5GJN8_ZINOF|nr:hypothetical protein ZIOFF_033012 [Zingiber officinale]
MGRGVSSGGGQSSLGYLFGGGEAPKSASDAAAPVQKPAPPPPINKEIPAGIQSSQAKNFYSADGQNCTNFITLEGMLPQCKQHAVGYISGSIWEVNQIDLRLRCTLLLVAVLLLDTCSVMVVNDADL